MGRFTLEVDRLGKYLEVMKVGWQDAVIYKGDFVITSVMKVLRIVIEMIFWTVVFEASEKSVIAGYTLNSIITYYILMFLIGTVMNQSEVCGWIASDIREGGLSQYLVKPINYLGYYFAKWGSKTFLHMLITALALTPVFLLGLGGLVLDMNLFHLFAFPLVVACGIVLNYLLNTIVALIAFWFVEIDSLMLFKMFVFEFLSGAWFPLDILHPSILGVSRLLPFQYVVYFPISILNKGVSNHELLFGMAMQMGWILCAFVVMRLLWKAGLTRFSGSGM